MRRPVFLMILAVLGALAAGPALAQPPRLPGVLPLDRILPGIRRSHPGQNSMMRMVLRPAPAARSIIT